MGELLLVGASLENNIPGSVIQGAALKSPAPLYSNKRRSEHKDLEKPDLKEMDLLYNSFKPGLPEQTRYALQDQGHFFKTQYPASSYSSRVNSLAARLASVD